MKSKFGNFYKIRSTFSKCDQSQTLLNLKLEQILPIIDNAKNGSKFT